MFGGWWDRRLLLFSGKGLNSLMIFGTWTLWVHRNKCVFDGASPRVACALMLAVEVLHFWNLARARGITHLLALAPLEG
jgi:hypothetical protein